MDYVLLGLLAVVVVVAAIAGVRRQLAVESVIDRSLERHEGEDEDQLLF